MICDYCKNVAPIKYTKRISIRMEVENQGTETITYNFCMFCLLNKKVQIFNEIKLVSA